MTSFAVAAGALAAVAILAVSAQAEVQNRRGWVSGTGTDTGICSFVAPCRTLQFAVDQIGAGGEVNVKDSGDYGPATITKAISIIADGSVAEVNVLTGSTGIVVNASTVDAVVLRGLTFSGRDSVRTYGVRVITAGRIVVDHCIFTGLANALVYETASTSSAVTDSFFARNDLAIQNTKDPSVVLGRNVVTQNQTGLLGIFRSFGDNDVTDNGGFATITLQSRT